MIILAILFTNFSAYCIGFKQMEVTLERRVDRYSLEQIMITNPTKDILLKIALVSMAWQVFKVLQYTQQFDSKARFFWAADSILCSIMQIFLHDRVNYLQPMHLLQYSLINIFKSNSYDI